MDTPTWNPYLIDMPAKSPLYDQDFFAWSRQQTDLLRAGDLARADIEHIAEEIESLGRTEKRGLISRLTVLLFHLLKWRYQPEKRGATWEASIRVQRNRLADHLEDNPSLKPLLPRALLSQQFSFSRLRRFCEKVACVLGRVPILRFGGLSQ